VQSSIGASHPAVESARGFSLAPVVDLVPLREVAGSGVVQPAQQLRPGPVPFERSEENREPPVRPCSRVMALHADFTGVNRKII
jgi:hypothetical protein